MLDDLHALGLVSVVVIALGFLLLDFGFAHRWTGYLAGVGAIAAIGLVSMLLLNARGIPIIEWALPLAMFLLIGLFIRGEQSFRAFRLLMFGMAAALSVSFISLVSDSYAVALDRPTQASNQAILQNVARKVRQLEGELPQAPVESIVGPVGSPTIVSENRLWHTWFTRLRERRAATIWSPGGKPEFVAENLQLRPRSE